jgi:hypothetical protein
MSGQSDFLSAPASFLEGVGRILDFGDFLTEYNRTLTPEMADEIATAMDWQAVYRDLYTAYQNYLRSVGGTEWESIAAGAGA